MRKNNVQDLRGKAFRAAFVPAPLKSACEVVLVPARDERTFPERE